MKKTIIESAEKMIAIRPVSGRVFLCPDGIGQKYLKTCFFPLQSALNDIILTVNYFLHSERDLEMIKRMMLLSAVWIAFHAVGADSADSPSNSGSGDKNVDIRTVAKEKDARIRTLTEQHRGLLEKQKQKRKELLKNNPKIRRMYLQILKQVRQLAMELDANREISQINDRIHETEKELRKERDELEKLNERIKLNTLKETEKNK